MSLPNPIPIVAALLAGIHKLKLEIDQQLVGRQAIIQSNYNGQPMGTSKKSRRGEMVAIREVYLSGDRLSVFVEDWPLGMGLDELAIVEEEAKVEAKEGG